MLRDGSRTITAQLIAFMDAVEVHVRVADRRRRRLRFLRDSAARQYAQRMRDHLEQRGYRKREERPR